MTFVLIDGPSVNIVPPNVLVLQTHDLDDCIGRACVIHNPSDHPMRTFPLHWRHDRGMFERICEHGIGHPDPDQRVYWLELGEKIGDPDPERHADALSLHGCDGCCGEYMVE